MLFIILLSLLFNEPKYVVHTTTPDKIQFHYKANGENYLDQVKTIIPKVQFVMNASMYTPSYKPVGLYVEKGKVVSKLKILNNSKVNFGISQAVFYINKAGKAGIIKATEAKVSDYNYAVQLAPMLVEKGKINPRIADMKTVYRRNAFGVTKQGKVVMVVTIDDISMPRLAQIMVKLGCENAAFVDGAVSRYWKVGTEESDIGPFGVIVSGK